MIAILPAILVVSTCGGQDEKGLEIFFESPLGDYMTELQLTLYQDPAPDLCDPTLMAAPSVWTPTSAAPYQQITMTYSEAVELDLNPGAWGFVFRGGDGVDYPLGTRDMARGCTTVELQSGVNPPVVIEIQEIFYPGVCGDGNLDPEEMCDDGNTLDDNFCSANCLSTPVKVLNFTTDNSQYDPHIAAGSSGYVVTYTSSSDFSEDSELVRAQFLDADGELAMMGGSNDVKLNARSTPLSQENADVAVSGDTFTSVWLDFNNALTVAGDVQSRTISLIDGSGALESILNTVTAGTQIEPVIAGNGTSTTLISAWTSSASAPQDVMCRLISAGTPSGVEASCASTTDGDQTQPAAAMAPDGSYAVAWRGPDATGSGVWVRFFSSAGAALGVDVAVNTTVAGDQTHPQLAYDSDGRLLVVFLDSQAASNPVIRGRLFSTAGAADGDDFVVSVDAITDASGGAAPAVAGDDGVFIVVWYSPDTGVRGRLVSGQGTFAINRLVSSGAGNPFIDTGEFAVTPEHYAETQDPQVAVSQSGKALVIWVDRSAGASTDMDVRGRIIPTN